MASTFSFDVVSSFDQQELKNALDQARRETGQRYDLKDTKSTIELTDNLLTLESDSEYALDAVRDMVESKFIKRGLSLKILDYGEVKPAAGSRYRQEVKLKEGIPDDLAKQISKRIRDEFKKVTPQIQGDSLRIQAKSKDDLQGVITALKESDYPVALQFVNFR